MKTDVVIIGGGVVGSAIAYELAKFDLDIVLVEKEDDVAMGTSKANSGIIHAGYNAQAGTLKGELNVKANPKFDQLCADLKVPFKRIGSLVVGFSEEDLAVLEQEKQNGEQLGVPGLEIISGEQLFELEPNLNPKAKYALYAPTAGIISPYELTIALADIAVINGVKILLETEVIEIISDNQKISGVKTNKGMIEAKIVINAAGVHADEVAAMAQESFKITPRKGEYHLLDKKWGSFVNHVLFPVPKKDSKGILVTPTAHGNLLMGPNSHDVEDKTDLSVTKAGLDEVYQGVRKLVPALNRRDVIASFSGQRAVAGEDFIIGRSQQIKGLINAVGIQSPGLSAAPAIGELVAELVQEVSREIRLEVALKADFCAILLKSFQLATAYDSGSLADWQQVVEADPEYGEIICRCEKVTKGEILDAIRRPLPARTLDAVKRRTRSGMGRCQGGFCGPKVVEIIAEELGILPLQVTKKGSGSEILVRKTKDLNQLMSNQDESKAGASNNA